MLVSALLIAAGVYCAAVAVMYALQRRLMYPGSERAEPPETVGLDGVLPVRLPTADGLELLAWWMPPADGRPVVLYWHGNAGPLHCRANKFRAFGAAGYGMLMPAYRGFSGNPGKPSQPALLRDAVTALAWLQRQTDAPLVYFGESLGGGVAMHLAAKHPPRAIILEGAFDSAGMLAQRRYPIIPANRLLRDRWDNFRLAPACPAPVLMLHGSEDKTVPIAHARRLYEALPEPKRFVTLEGTGHIDLFDFGGDCIALDWLREQGL
jgi:fermentation-respiration switch protein FrsA (DUF1100 family)